VDSVTNLELKVGTKHAVAPHYYGFTWVRLSSYWVPKRHHSTSRLRKNQFPHYQKEQPL
jgi:hypothetical protein